MLAKKLGIFRRSLYLLVSVLAIVSVSQCGKIPEESAVPKVTVEVSTKGDSDLTTVQELSFAVTHTSAADSTESEPIKSAVVLYTLDGTDPNSNSLKLEVDLTAPAVEGNATTFTTSSSLTISETKQLKYMAMLTLDHKTSSKSALGQVKSTTEDLIVSSSTSTETYTFSTATPSTTTTTSTETKTAAPDKFSLTATSGTPTALVCFSLTLTAQDSAGTTIKSNAKATITLSTTTGSGAFYSNSSCTTVTTTASVASGSSSTKVYYKDNYAESIALVATYNSVASTWSATLGGPPISAFVFATASHASCAPVSFYFRDSSSSTMIESVNQATTVTLTQTSGPVTGTFYSSSDCTTGSLTSGSVTTVSISANSSGSTLYFSNGGNSGTYSFSGSWTCGSSGTSGYTSSFFL